MTIFTQVVMSEHCFRMMTGTHKMIMEFLFLFKGCPCVDKSGRIWVDPRVPMASQKVV